MKLRILQILHTLHRAGVERLVQDLAIAHGDRLDTAVVCLDHEGPLADSLRRRDIPVHFTHRRGGLDFRQVARIAAILRAFNPHVIHCHQYTPSFYGALASWWARTGKVLFTEHGRHFPDVVGHKRRLVNRLLVRRAAAITAVCEFTRRSLIDREGLPAEKIEVVYNGVDPARFENGPDRREARRGLDLSPDAAVLIHVGTFRPVKDQRMALAAFQTIRHSIPHAVLLFVGDGPDLDDCRRQAEQAGCRDAVRFLGQRDDIPDLLPAADLFLMTSKSEAHSVAILEAMACRLPVVATRVGGIPETVVHGDTGLLAEPDPAALADAAVQLLKDPYRRFRMGHAAHARVQQCFTQARMHQKYLEIYDRLSR